MNTQYQYQPQKVLNIQYQYFHFWRPRLSQYVSYVSFFGRRCPTNCPKNSNALKKYTFSYCRAYDNILLLNNYTSLSTILLSYSISGQPNSLVLLTNFIKIQSPELFHGGLWCTIDASYWFYMLLHMSTCQEIRF